MYNHSCIVARNCKAVHSSLKPRKRMPPRLFVADTRSDLPIKGIQGSLWTAEQKTYENLLLSTFSLPPLLLSIPGWKAILLLDWRMMLLLRAWSHQPRGRKKKNMGEGWDSLGCSLCDGWAVKCPIVQITQRAACHRLGLIYGRSSPCRDQLEAGEITRVSLTPVCLPLASLASWCTAEQRTSPSQCITINNAINETLYTENDTDFWPCCTSWLSLLFIYYYFVSFSLS